jgi:catechol 2,3-dioxygenase-like lactoylglutathione lyase family enzyme
MAKIRHLTIATRDLEKVATFYKSAFEFEEVGRTDPNDPNVDGIYLSDGTLNLAIIKFNQDELGKGIEYAGLHHFGVLVDDMAGAQETIEGLGAECFMQRGKDAPLTARFEMKFRGPDGVVFEVSGHPWLGSAPLEGPARTA